MFPHSYRFGDHVSNLIDAADERITKVSGLSAIDCIFDRMTEPFLLPVSHKGLSYDFPARLVLLGYIYQFHIEMEGRVLIFEKDDERNYRVIDNTPDAKPVDKHLLEAVIRSLVTLQND